MKQYRYVNQKIGRFFTCGTLKHREIIDQYAKEGYRYVGFMPTKIEGYGRITEVDLIFEREE